jgi:hypothetical protein
MALHLAARNTENGYWEAAALDIGRHAANRPQNCSGVMDATFCHGAAGLGHIFNRLYQFTGQGDYRDAARSWFKWALDFRCQGRGIAGFAAFRVDHPGRHHWEANAGVLEGVSGIGLALLAAAVDVEPQWDRAFLISGPSAEVSR